MRNIVTGSTTLFAIIKKIFIKKLKIILTMVTKSQSKFHLATHSYPSHKIHLTVNTAPQKRIFTFTVKPTERHLSRGPQDFLQFLQVDSQEGGNIPKGLKTQQNPRQNPTLLSAPKYNPPNCSHPGSVRVNVQLLGKQAKEGEQGREPVQLLRATSPHLLLQESCHLPAPQLQCWLFPLEPVEYSEIHKSSLKHWQLTQVGVKATNIFLAN